VLIGFDIDGVLYPWVDIVNEACVDEFGIDDPGQHLEWAHLKTVLSRKQWNWVWSAKGQNTVFSQSDRIYPGVKAEVNKILKAGHQVHFVTHRDPRRTAVFTAEFLDLHFSRHPWAGVHVLQNSVKKAELLPWDVFVDDKEETCHDMLEAGVGHVFAPAREWNKGLAKVRSRRFTRYEDFAEVTTFVNGRT